MKKKSNSVRLLVCIAAIALCLPVSSAGAMHIMEGYLPVGWCVLWGALCLPFLVWGGISL